MNRQPQHYPPIPLRILKGFLFFFHITTLTALVVAFAITLINARGDWSWQDTIVSLALALQACLYLGLVALYPTYPPPRWAMPVYFTGAILLWLVEVWLSPSLFWLGFTFIGHLFGIMPLLPSLTVSIFILTIIFYRGPFDGLIPGATPMEKMGWVFSWASILVLLVYISILTRSSRERAYLVDQLRQAQKELEAARNKEAELAVLRERERLARDLHDSLGHNLVALSVQLEAVQRLYPVDPQAATEVLNDLKRLTRGSMEELRRTLEGMRSPGLGGRPLRDALQELCADFGRRNGQSLEFTWEIGAVELPEPVAEILWRTAQEGLTNIEKHAPQAGHVSLRLYCSGSQVRLQIEDDGAGFVPQTQQPGHFGLAGMRERVQGVGGTLEVDSVPGRGTRLLIEIPTLEMHV